MCICTHIHIYMYTYIHVVCIIEFVGLSVLDVLYWCPTSLLCAYIHIYIYTYIHIFIYSYTHIYTNTYIHIYMLYVSSSSCVSMCSSSWDVKDSLGGWRAFVFSSRGSRCARVHAWCQVCGSVCALEFVGRKWLIGWVTFVSGLEFICRFEFVGLCVLEFICDVEFVGLFRVVGMWVTCGWLTFKWLIECAAWKWLIEWLTLISLLEFLGLSVLEFVGCVWLVGWLTFKWLIECAVWKNDSLSEWHSSCSSSWAMIVHSNIFARDKFYF